MIPNIYSSKVVLAPSNQSESMASYMSSYSSLAGMAGISLPSEKGNKSQEAMERLISFDFFENQFLPFIKLQDLMASKKWHQGLNKIIYKEDIFNSSENVWIQTEDKKIPTKQQSFKVFKKIFSISEDKNTGFVSLTISHHSPHIAKEWVNIITNNINESMREIDKKSAIDSINFLNKEAQSTKLTELNQAISQLLESQMQTLMFASVSEEYIFKIINPAVASETKSSPDRALICILGAFIGLIIGFILSLVTYYKLHILK